MNSRYKKIVSTLGKLPEKVKPDVKFGEAKDYPSYTLYNISYMVEENERVNAFLLIPKNAKSPLPAVVAAHQHAGQYHLGKSEPAGLAGDPMYFYGKELAERGFAVICPDHLGFEERRPSDEELKRRFIDAGMNERELFCNAISRGSTLQGKYVFDLSVAADVIVSDLSGNISAEIDGGRLGVIGHSLGGQEALWLTFFDSRIKAGVSSCGFSTVQAVFYNHIPHNLAMFTFGLLDAGDNVALMESIALEGKAFMMTNGTADRIFPMKGVYEIHSAASGIYAANNKSGHFNPVVFDGEHSFPEELRNEAYDFLEKFLK